MTSSSTERGSAWKMYRHRENDTARDLTSMNIRTSAALAIVTALTDWMVRIPANSACESQSDDTSHLPY
jgi:hypothetical protein